MKLVGVCTNEVLKESLRVEGVLLQGLPYVKGKIVLSHQHSWKVFWVIL